MAIFINELQIGMSSFSARFLVVALAEALAIYGLIMGILLWLRL